MKNLISFFIAFATLSSVNAQSLVYALVNNGGAEGFSNFATIDPLTGTILDLAELEEVEGIVLGSSTMDQLNGMYMFSGIDTQGLGRTYVQDVNTGIVNSEDYGLPFMNGAQYDMSTGLTYGLGYEIIDSVLAPGGMYYDYIFGSTFVEADYSTGEIGFSVPLPEVEAMVLGASTFDPISGVYFLIGLRPDYQMALFGIEASTGFVFLDLPLNLGQNEFLDELEFDIANGIFYALHRQGENFAFATLDPVTGVITDLLDISDEVEAFTPDASVYHQETGRFTMLTYNNFQTGLLTIDVDDNEVIAHPSVSYSLIEMEVDNIQFANATFTSLSEEDLADAFNVFPNPADEVVVVQWNDASPLASFILTDMAGRQVAQGPVLMNQAIDTADLAEGLYTLTLETLTSRSSQKVLIQH
jgi:hypothetical protein